jgi:TonB-linked SusC/RagA family outer membrane protein
LKKTLFILIFGLWASLNAQQKTVSGVVTDEFGVPLPGVNVIVQGTQSGTQTDFDGNYQITAQEGQVLMFSYLGLKNVLRTIGAPNRIDVQMFEDAQALDEIVVTALGISREKKSLGYATQVVGGDDVSQSRQSNALSALSGRVAGAQITTPSGNLGGSTRILLRGAGSITQNNKPLIVVDGLPLDNSNYNTTATQTGSGGYDFGDTGFDINPDDIESMNILKGGAAAALYGARANNGAIIITTKSGKNGKSEIVINSGVSFDDVNIFPKVQKLYGGGAGNPNTIGQSDFRQATINGVTYDIVDYATDESWGPRFDPNRLVLHWDAFDPEFADDYLTPRPWVYPKADKEDFFNTGVSVNNGVAFSYGNEKAKTRFSVNNTQSKGIVPNSELDKTTLNFNGSIKPSEKLEISSSANFTVTDGFNRPAVGYSSNSVALQFLQFGQTQLDVDRLKNYVLSDGTQRTWNRTAYDNPTPRFTDNPYWVLNNNIAKDRRTRFYGNIGLKYNLREDLYFTAKVYGDSYDSRISTQIAEGSQSQSGYGEANRDFLELNYEFILNYSNTFFGNKLSLDTFIGANRRDNRFNSLLGNTNGGLAVPNIYNLENSNGNATIQDYDERKRVNSVFGSVSFGYNSFAYLTVTGRNDWSSTLPEDNNSYFYPSINGSIVFSQLLNLDWLSLGKIRGGYAQVGSDADPYQLANVFSSRQPFLGTIRYSQPDSNLNPNLKPEEKTTWEVGLEMALLNNRISFDFTYYNETTEDLITPVQVDASTGYRSTVSNAGKLENKGIEALVNITPIQSDNFDWNFTWNFSRNRNKLLELLPGVETLQLASLPFQGITLNAVVGEPYGVLRGTDFIYDDNGRRVVGSNGRYLQTNTVQNLGSILPDYNMGFRNSFRYKNFDLSVLIDVQKGGKYRSLTNVFGHYSGILEDTAANNIREEGIVIDAVQGDVVFNDDGSYTVSNTSENTQVISAQQWGQDHFFGPAAQNVFDADYFKLREVTLGYTLPKKWTEPIGANSLRLTAFGRNLFIWGLDNDNFDPEVASGGSGNIQGTEGGSLPSTRTYGLNLQLKF